MNRSEKLLPRKPNPKIIDRAKRFLKYFDFSSSENVGISIDDEIIKYMEACRVVVLPSGWVIYPNLVRSKKERKAISKMFRMIEISGKQSEAYCDKGIYSKTTPLLSGYEIWQVEITTLKGQNENILINDFGEILPTENAALFAPNWNPDELKFMTIPRVIF